MRPDQLLSPALVTQGSRLRHDVAKAISAAELAVVYNPNSETANRLKTFLQDAANKCPGVSSVAPSTPTEPPVEPPVEE